MSLFPPFYKNVTFEVTFSRDEIAKKFVINYGI